MAAQYQRIKKVYSLLYLIYILEQEIQEVWYLNLYVQGFY